MLPHAGLWGDGDEIEAIELIERRLNVRLRDEYAPEVRTVGDLWDALKAGNPDFRADRRSWRRMAVALTAYTALDPRQIGVDTLLIEPKRPGILANLFRFFSENRNHD